jgi:hypothetical protein
MEKTAAGVPDGTLNHITQYSMIPLPNVLQHSNRYECIVVPADVAVIVFHEFDRMTEAFPRRSVARKGDLLAGDVEGPHLHAVTFRHVQRKRTPPAASLNNSLAGLQTKFSADKVQLCRLRCFQAGIPLREVRACVNQVLIKPELVEVIRKIVVAMYVVARSTTRVGLRQPEPPGEHSSGHSFAKWRAVDALKQLDKITFDLNASITESVAERNLRIRCQREQCSAIANANHRSGDGRIIFSLRTKAKT